MRKVFDFRQKSKCFPQKKFLKKFSKENKKKISIKFMRKSEADTELLWNNDFDLSTTNELLWHNDFRLVNLTIMFFVSCNRR